MPLDASSSLRSLPSPLSPSSPLATSIDTPQTLSPLPAETPHPDSPSASTFLRTAATLEGLARQLGEIRDDEAGGGTRDGEGATEWRCCCGRDRGCRTWEEREREGDKLKLSGEIGNALLQKYEAMEQKFKREVERYERQLEAKRTALVESVRRVNNLERANTQHLHKYAEMSRRYEALEKRYTQSQHAQTLTQHSLTHVRAELTTLRAQATRRTFEAGQEVEDRLEAAERRWEAAKEESEEMERKAREEGRKRKRAEARIAELEEQLGVATKEVEEIREARTRDAQDLLANARDRLDSLHAELSETFQASDPSQTPEYQRALEDLVASNALLKHDASELSHLLAESRDEVRTLREEVDELRSAVGVAGRISPVARHLESELARGGTYRHSRTESSPVVAGNMYDHRSRRLSASSSSRAGGVGMVSAWEHHRRMSMAPSFTSTSTFDAMSSPPGLGMGPIGEFGAPLEAGESALSPPALEGRESPKPMFRTSPSGGIAYVLNGVPKKPGAIVAQRQSLTRSVSERRRSGMGFNSFSSVGPIPEWQSPDDPPSPGAQEYFRAAEVSRKRRSLLLQTQANRAGSPRESIPGSPNQSHTLVDSPVLSDGTGAAAGDGRKGKRTLLLLSKERGVQTSPPPQEFHREPHAAAVHKPQHTSQAPSVASSTSPMPFGDPRSETSSLLQSATDVNRPGISPLFSLIEHTSKLLSRLRASDIPTLNRRLRKQHLPGADVAHLSRSALRALQDEVDGLRHSFRAAELNALGVDRKDWSLLLKLLREIFSDLVALQAIVNDVTIEPRLAKKLRNEAARDETEDGQGTGGEDAGKAGALGWLAAPLTKFFVTPAAATSAGDGGDGQGGVQSSPRAGAGLDRGRLKPTSGPQLRAPKLQASTSATTTHVSVEFGGKGIVRRSTPAEEGAKDRVVDALPSSPAVFAEGGDTVRGSSTGSSGLAPPTMRGADPTLRASKSRTNRNELLGIFAGAAGPSRPPLTTNASMTSNGAPRTLRAASSQYFADKTVRGPRNSVERKRLSAAVDAVVDSTAEQIQADPGGVQPPLLERTMRKRGLSDSSIRSTFVSHGADLEAVGNLGGVTMGGPAQRAEAYGASGGMLSSLASRFYPFRASTTPAAPPSDALPAKKKTEPQSPSSSPSTVPSSSATPPTSVPRSREKKGGRDDAISPSSMTGSGGGGAGAGLLGMLAESLVGREEAEGGGRAGGGGRRRRAGDESPEDEGFMEARLRGVGGGRRSASSKGAWR